MRSAERVTVGVLRADKLTKTKLFPIFQTVWDALVDDTVAIFSQFYIKFTFEILSGGVVEQR